MSSPVSRVFVCLTVALLLASDGRADEAEAKKQLKKIGVYVVGTKSESATALDKTKSTDTHVKLLPEIKNLTAVRLGDTDITDAGLKDVARVKGLRQLQLFGAPGVTDEGVKELAVLA